MLLVIDTQLYVKGTEVKDITINKTVTAGVVCFFTAFVSFTTCINLCIFFEVKIFSVVQ